MGKSVRVSEAPQANLDALFEKKGGVKALTPEQQLYGIYGPQYAALLSRDKHGSTENASDKAILAQQSGLEQTRYDAALAAANAAQQQIAVTEGNTDTRGKIITSAPAYAEHGMAGALGQIGGGYGVFDDPGAKAILGVADRSQLNMNEAERANNQASAIKTTADAGYGMAPSDVSKKLTNPEQTTPDTYNVYQTPADKTKAYGTDQGKTFDQQMELAKVRAQATVDAANARGGQMKFTITQQPGGAPTVTYTASNPQTLIDNGIDPQTGDKINPKAGANSGTAPASHTAPTPTVKVHPVADGVSVVKQLYPDAHVTEGHRDPKSKLGRANPDSWHNKTNAAVDVRPMKNRTFEQYIQGFKDKGYPIIEARDEEKHPVKWQTGPNWHVVLGDRTPSSVHPDMPMNIHITRLKMLPNVADAVDLGGGRILVTSKTGKQAVFLNGKQVG